jgi:hypothetical protein
MFEPKWIRATAKESGLIERERKIDPLMMFWTLAIGYGSQLYRTLTELKREYEAGGNVSISDSIWHDRFTPELVKISQTMRNCGSKQESLSNLNAAYVSSYILL